MKNFFREYLFLIFTGPMVAADTVYKKKKQMYVI